MCNNEPLVSTLICVYNSEDFFDATIRSVVDQTHINQEILIRDDDSSDGTFKLIQERAKRDSRIKLFGGQGVKKGPYGGLNYLLDHARGEYIAIQDHDDIWHPSKLEKQVYFLQNKKNYCAVGSILIDWFKDRGIYFIPHKKSSMVKIVGHTSLLFRNQGYRYDASLSTGNDSFFMYNSFEYIYLLGDPLVIHTKHSSNFSKERSRNIKGRFQMRKYGIISFKQLILGFIYGFFPTLWFLLISLFSPSTKTTKEDIIKYRYGFRL